MTDQVSTMIDMGLTLVKDWVASMMDEVVQEMSSNDVFFKGIVMAAAVILLLRQVYIQLRRGEPVTREALVSGIKDSTDEIVEDFTRITNEAKEKFQGMRLRNSKVLPGSSEDNDDDED